MPFLLGFLFLAAVYSLLFTVSRLEKKRKSPLNAHRVRPGLRQQQPQKSRQKATAKNTPVEAVGESFRTAEVKASRHDRKLKTTLEELEQREHRLRELETDIWAKELGSPSPKQTTQQSDDDWETPHQRVIEDDWQQPSQDQETADRIPDGIQRREQEKQAHKELARLENERAEQARQQFRETQRQQDLEAEQQRQIQEANDQKFQQEIESDRQRLRQEREEFNRQMEADRIRLRREKEAAALKLEQDMEADRQRLRNAQSKAKSADRSRSKKTRQSSPVTHQIKSKLEKLCGSDNRLAQRLVDGIRIDHPDRSEQWCWEKAVWDMERDRHY